MSAVRRISRLSPLAALLLAACAGQLERSTALPTTCGGSTGGPWLGCANRANLAAMVADPADLERGRQLTPASALHAAQVVEAYEAPPSGGTPEVARTETTK
jgi:hypothetical protein